MSQDKLKSILSTVINRFVPMYKNTVFFDSFSGQYNDNPKYISEALHRLNPEVNIVWTTSDHGHDVAPDYAKK